MVPPRLSDRERELLEELGKVSTFDPRKQGR
jgi:curved DNA-binding protein